MKTHLVRQLLISCAISLMVAAGVATPALAAPEAITGPGVKPSPSVVAGFFGNAYIGNPWDARVRACASTRCRAIGIMKYGSAVHVDYSRGGWSHVGRGRWVLTRLITKVMPTCK